MSAPASPRLSAQHPKACRRVLTSKSALATGQDKGSDGIVCVELLERSIELVEERGTERVERLGAVERDEADALGGARREDELVLGGGHEADRKRRGTAESAGGAEGSSRGGGEEGTTDGGKHGGQGSCRLWEISRLIERDCCGKDVFSNADHALHDRREDWALR